MTEQLPPGLALAWGITPGPGKRGPKPAHSVARIVGAAVQLADAGGFAAVSMPKIARHLGITANALYRYINSKDELLVLMAEAGWGPPPDMSSQAWRSACTTWVQAAIERFRVHPWLLDLPVRGAPVTPNLLRWLEVLLESLVGTGLRNQDMLGCAQLLDGYARSTALLVRGLTESTAAPLQSVLDFLQPRLQGFPRVATLMASGEYRDEEDPAPDLKDDVEFGLGRILDGIHALILRRPETQEPPVE
ncbi:TetR/AcrR family transcriptional regulator [Kibdelosporangium phytohabitans]|nr:TetR family transcriptional regulator [Kibdelosporangium phytohabitans]MBE1463596.1 AcrR family transcriptional regulator [Kibdelosporangium phytohabitans]